MKNNRMSLATAKTLTTGLLVGCVVCCLLSLLLTGLPESVRTAIGWAAILLAVLGVACLVLFCRCPWCGAHLFRGLFKLKICPSCRRDLYSGVKKKGSGGKRPRR